MKTPWNVKLLEWICNLALVVCAIFVVVFIYLSYSTLNNLPEAGKLSTDAAVDMQLSYNMAGNEFKYRLEKDQGEKEARAHYYYIPNTEHVEFNLSDTPTIEASFGEPIADSLMHYFADIPGVNVMRTDKTQQLPLISGKPAIPIDKATFVEYVKKQRWIYPIALMYVFVVIGMFRKFVVGLRKPDFFTPKNAQYLSWSGILIMISPFLEIFVKWIFIEFPFDNIIVNGHNLKEASYNFDFQLLIFGLIILVIAYTFKQGVKIQKEQKLTI